MNIIIYYIGTYCVIDNRCFFFLFFNYITRTYNELDMAAVHLGTKAAEKKPLKKTKRNENTHRIPVGGYIYYYTPYGRLDQKSSSFISYFLNYIVRFQCQKHMRPPVGLTSFWATPTRRFLSNHYKKIIFTFYFYSPLFAQRVAKAPMPRRITILLFIL